MNTRTNHFDIWYLKIRPENIFHWVNSSNRFPETISRQNKKNMELVNIYSKIKLLLPVKLARYSKMRVVSLLQMIFQIGVFINFATYTGKLRCFPLNIEKFLRATFLQNTSGDCLCLHLNSLLLTIKHSLPPQISGLFEYTLDDLSI